MPSLSKQNSPVTSHPFAHKPCRCGCMLITQTKQYFTRTSSPLSPFLYLHLQLPSIQLFHFHLFSFPIPPNSTTSSIFRELRSVRSNGVHCFEKRFSRLKTRILCFTRALRTLTRVCTYIIRLPPCPSP